MTESIHALSGAYVVDALDDDERELFEQHLPSCLDCQHEVASMREGAAVMADAVAAPPPAHLRDSVLAGIRTIRPLPPVNEAEDDDADAADDETAGPGAKVVAMRPRRLRTARLVAAAAVLAAVGAGAVWQPWQDSTSTTQLSAADRVLGASDVKHVSLSFDDGSTATVFRSQREKAAVLVARGMAAPPHGKAFELWLRDSSGRMLPAGLMHRAGDQKILLKGDALAATGVGITVEPAGGSQKPTTEPIAMFELDKAEA